MVKRRSLFIVYCYLMYLTFFQVQAYAFNENAFKIQPEVIIYCWNSPSGYHEGVAKESFCRFFDESVFPYQKIYVEGCKDGEPGYVKWECVWCQKTIYIDSCIGSYRGHYIYSSDVHYIKDCAVYHACVLPSSINYTNINLPDWIFIR
ncbi:MAG: hypothetical protein N2486_02220 [Caloramator sp.]|nr:hypothetical protein [Caloramator sp.]